MDGRIDEGSCKVPMRKVVNCGLADEFAKRWLPHCAQKRRHISFPLSAVLLNSVRLPDISIAAVGKIALTVPLAEICWQARHQQALDANGSPLTR
jgi:hypothetical protein